MAEKHSSLTLARFRELLSYDPLTGEFRRLVHRPKSPAGAIAGCLDNHGYRHIMIDYVRYKAHRLAWLVMTGELPINDIDHIDGNKGNNAFANLREVDMAANMQNRRRANKNNKGGLLGATWHKGAGAWRADIVIGRKQKYLGLYPTAEEAHSAYLTAKRELHPFGTL